MSVRAKKKAESTRVQRLERVMISALRGGTIDAGCVKPATLWLLLTYDKVTFSLNMLKPSSISRMRILSLLNLTIFCTPMSSSRTASKRAALLGACCSVL